MRTLQLAAIVAALYAPGFAIAADIRGEIDQTGWSFGGQADGGTTVLLTRPGPVANKIWARYELAEPKTFDGRSYLVSVSLQEVDCKEGRIRTLQLSTYPQRNMLGQSHSVPPSRVNQEWEYPIPDSFNEVVFFAACKR